MAHWSTQPEQSSSVFQTSGLLEPHHEWGCFCQAGDNGVVFTKKEPYSYHTAFFEAFPRSPDTFIRGEGKDIIEAEEDAWRQYSKIVSCPEHEFERRGYRNGGGFCKHCGLFSMVFEPLERCVICNTPTYHTYDKDYNWYCEKHENDIPVEKWTDFQLGMAYEENEIWDWEHRDSESLGTTQKEGKDER